jgi:hypothetical protein
LYAFVDRPVTSLDKGCRFLVWSMRSWVAVVRSRTCPGPALAPAFARWRMIAGLQPFLRLMLSLDRDALDRLQFCSLRCNRICEHEAVLLSVFTALASEDTGTARDTLALLVNPDTLGDCFGAAAEVAQVLHRADIAPGKPEGSHARR